MKPAESTPARSAYSYGTDHVYGVGKTCTTPIDEGEQEQRIFGAGKE